MTKPEEKPVVRLKPSSHQPTKAQMEEDVSIATSAAARHSPVGVRIVAPPRPLQPTKTDTVQFRSSMR